MTPVFPSRAARRAGRGTGSRILIVAALALGCDQNMSDVPLPDATAEERARLADRLTRAPELSAPAGATISGFIELAPRLQPLTASNDVLFVIARAPGDDGPPAAVQRLTGNAYPMPFALEAPGSSELQLVVKVDKDGDAGTTGGEDLLGFTPDPVRGGDAGVRILVEATFAELTEALADTAASPEPVESAREELALEGEIDLPPELRPRTSEDDVVFVIARNADAGGPPVAVARLRGNEYPLRFRLDETSRMLGGPLPSRLIVEARRDADGDPLTRGSGDLTARLADPVAPAAGGLRLRLQAAQP